jgi:protein-disulfide isomerase/uncharacterized membrane protein
MSLWQHKNQIIPLPYHYYYFTVTIIGLIGFFDSLYLAVSHYRVYTDIGYESFCALSRAINCDTVSQSPYSILLGVPVPVWGILGYAFFVTLLLYAWPKKGLHKRIWSLLLLVSIGFSTYSIVLACISTIWIHSYCVMCIFSYAVNLSLVYFIWLIRNRFHCESFYGGIKLDISYLLNFPKLTVAFITLFLTGAIILLLFFPPYWHLKPPALSGKVPTGITEDGHPWIGAQDPELEIIEFTDYQCFQCKKMHFFLLRLIEKHPDKIRLIHRHFPMDHTINPLVHKQFHAGSAKLAILAIFATEKQKFWEMNDLLFNLSGNKEVVNIQSLADKTDIDFSEMRHVFRDRKLWMKLQNDIKDGIQYGVTGTPGFIINDQVYLGQIPPEILRQYLK